jgi:hypothetical protein
MAVVKRQKWSLLHAICIRGWNRTSASATGGAKGDLNGFTLLTYAFTTNAFPKLDSATVTAFLQITYSSLIIIWNKGKPII